MMYPKPITLVSPALRKSAQGQTCALRWSRQCDDETVVLAHVRGIWCGIGQKPSDLFTIYACRCCHDELDGRSGERPPSAEVLRAMIETQSRMLWAGLIAVKGDDEC